MLKLKNELSEFKNVSLYNDTFLNNFKEKINKYKKIKSPSILDMIKLNDEIKLLSKAQNITSFKNDNNIQNASEKKISDYNKKFNNKINELLNEKIIRKNSVNFLNKLCLLITNIITYMNSIDNNIFLLSKDDINQIITSLGEDFFFIIVIESVLLKTKKNYIDLEFNSDEDYLDYSIYNKPYILSTDLYYCLIDKILKQLLISIYNYYIKKNILIDNNSFSEFFSINSIFNKRIKTEDSILYISKQLEEIFKEEIAEKTINKKIEDKKHNRIIYIVPECFFDHIISESHFPELIKPDSWIKNDIFSDISYIKEIKNGVSEIILSNESQNVLELSQKKEFKINTSIIELFNELDKLSYKDVVDLDLSPFIPLSVIENEINYIKDNKDHLISKELYSKYITPLYQKYKKRSIVIEKIKEEGFISENEFKNHHNYKNRQLRLISMYESRRISNTFIQIAEILKDMRLYYINTIDYRSRMYPYNFLFSRTTGIYKHFLMDYESTDLDDSGLINLLNAYYTFNTELLNKFNKYCKEHYNKKDIINFFKDNQIKNNKSNYIYFKLLENEITKIYKSNNYKSSFLIELDQKSSSSVFLSFLFKQKSLARQCNILNEKGNDVPNYLSSKTLKFFHSKGWTTADEINIVNDFLSNRKLHKYAFMCFCYNQLAYGRWEQWFKNTNIQLNEKQKDCIIKFSQSYEEFLEMCFPNIIKKRDAINNIFKEILKDINEAHIKTLDNSTLKWKIFFKKSEIKKFKSIYSKENKRISFRNGIINNFNELDYGKMIRSFLPGLIHSIDAAVMRIIINKLYNKSGKKCLIQHIHDAVLIHPNYIDTFYFVINLIYNEEKILDNLLKKCILNVNLPSMRNDAIRKVLEIYKTVFENSDDNFKIEEVDINPRDMYCFEN